MPIGPVLQRLPGSVVFTREAERCGRALAQARSANWKPTIRCAFAWSAAAVLWGNGVVLAGRQFGSDQWITLIGVPGLGVAGYALLRRKGFGRDQLGMQWPRAEGARWLNVLLRLAVGWVVVWSLAGLASFGHDDRGLRTIRTLVGTAFGEELVHRGVLLAVWGSTGVAGWVVVAANVVTFGFWHIAGAGCWLAGRGTDSCRFQWGEVLGPGALAVVLVWVRLRFDSILAPAVFHAVPNITGVFKAPNVRGR